MEIEFTPEQQQGLEILAAQRGKAPAEIVRHIVAEALHQSHDAPPGDPPLKTGRGLLARYGPSPSKEEIDENRREMFRSFGERAL